MGEQAVTLCYYKGLVLDPFSATHCVKISNILIVCLKWNNLWTVVVHKYQRKVSGLQFPPPEVAQIFYLFGCVPF